MFSRKIVQFIFLLIGVYFLEKAHGYIEPKEPEEKIFLSSDNKQGRPPLQFAPGECPKQTGKCPASFQGTPPLILVSLDGFRPDYLQRGFSPTLNRIRECGTTADFIYPVFPAKTFPNHISIVTGLNPETHGIVDNTMFDPNTNKTFAGGKPDFLNPIWYQKEPLWVTAEKQGKKTAAFFYLGSEIKIKNVLPTYYKKYAADVDFDSRVDQILEWLDLPPAKRPSFLMLYVNQPDNAGHWHGPDSKEVNDAVKSVDQMVEKLFAGLQSRNLLNCVNVIVMSDHGMSDIDCKLVVNIGNYINVSSTLPTLGPLGRVIPIDPKDRNDNVINSMIKKMQCQSKHMRVFRKQQNPVRWHYANNDRIEPIFLQLDQNWNVVDGPVTHGDEICTGGTHGYDNYYTESRAMFMAHGPSIKSNNKIKPFINTELYELMSELINIRPEPNNGTRGSLHHILKSPKKLPNQQEQGPPATSIVPTNDQEYNIRVYAANCSCSQAFKQEEISNKSAKRGLHLPFGVPQSTKEDNNTLLLLYNEDNVVAYDRKYRMPIWTSFNLEKKKEISKVATVCFKGDARIPYVDTAQCNDYNNTRVKMEYIVQRPLYPTSFAVSKLAKEQASYISNSIPKSEKHTLYLETEMNKILNQWATDFGSVNVVMGSAFDLAATGRKPSVSDIMKLHEKYGPLVVPTHIFVVATWCSVRSPSLKDCDTSKLATTGFLLPNEPYTDNCEAPSDTIERNSARVVDIENLTGLSFFTGLPIYDAIRLRTGMPRTSGS